MIISVASGKGGTGKTLIATSLALTLAKNEKVQIADCDVEEPNVHIFVKPDIQRVSKVTVPTPSIDESRCTLCRVCADVCAFNALAVVVDKVLVFPEMCHGCGACAYFCQEQAITETDREIGVVEYGTAGPLSFIQGRLNIGEPMAVPIIRAIKGTIDESRTVILDASPGTSCPVVEAVNDTDFCLLATEPTPFGLNDLSIAVEMTKQLGVPSGVVINRCGEGDALIEDYCASEGIPILLKIPLDLRIAKLYSQGLTLVEGLPEWRPAFEQLGQDIKSLVADSAEYAAKEAGRS